MSSQGIMSVRRPVTALDCVLLKARNLALAPRRGPEISSQACLWVIYRRTTDTTHYKHAGDPLRHP